MIWYMCKYTPLELFAGFSAPVKHLPEEEDEFERADSLGHPNLCGYGKALLEAALRPEVQELVLVNCCDVVRRLYDILKRNRDMDFLYFLDLPHRSGPEEKKLLRRGLVKLKESYESYCGRSFDFRKAWEALPQKKCAEETEPCVSFAGAHGGERLLRNIRGMLPLRVRDDTCSGRRRLERSGETPEDEERFFERYAALLLEQFPCMRMEDIRQREREDDAVRGIIYHTMKFCDYYSFEYAALRGRTKVPLLKIETDGTRQSEGQLATRIQAFGEAGLGLEVPKRAAGGYVAGIDSGSTSTDAVILGPDKTVRGWAVTPTGAGASRGAEKAFRKALDRAGIQVQDITRVTATGYGRENIGMGDSTVTEITCHAKGAWFLRPGIRTVIDIGGQDSKVICLDENGQVENFVMNDKCAAGTGRFLEMMARTLELSLEEMSGLGREWKEDITISSMCTVFAESEVVSLIARNAAVPDIIHGLNKAVAAKTAALVHRLKGKGPYMMTGGVARNAGVVEAIGKKLGAEIYISEYSQLCGAIGAALAAAEE